MTDERLYRVLDSVAARLAVEGADAYWVSIEVAGDIQNTPDVETERHLGDAIVLWAEISDLVDAPGGPQSRELCERVARKAAAAWNSVDQSDPKQVADYFTHWGPRYGDDWRSAQKLT
jgi:hypothetical protein